jgi:hypothetical protein
MVKDILWCRRWASCVLMIAQSWSSLRGALALKESGTQVGPGLVTHPVLSADTATTLESTQVSV